MAMDLCKPMIPLLTPSFVEAFQEDSWVRFLLITISTHFSNLWKDSWWIVFWENSAGHSHTLSNRIEIFWLWPLYFHSGLDFMLYHPASHTEEWISYKKVGTILFIRRWVEENRAVWEIISQTNSWLRFVYVLFENWTACSPSSEKNAHNCDRLDYWIVPRKVFDSRGNIFDLRHFCLSYS